MKKAICLLIVLISVLFAFSLSVRAEEAEGYSDDAYRKEYEDFISSLPSDIFDRLPEGMTSDDPDKIAESVGEMSSIEFLFSELFGGLGRGIDNCLPTLVMLCGLVLVAAAGNTLGLSLFGGCGRLFSLCSRFCVFAAVINTSLSSLDTLREFFTSLNQAVSSSVPLVAALFAMGGNVTAAATQSASVTAVLAICEFICSYTVVPVFCLCLCFSLMSAFDIGNGISGIASSVKKWYNTALAFVMMILGTSISAQTFISAKTDNAAMRGAKFMAGNFIPISGGTISSSLGTIASGIELLRSAVGIGGIIILVMLLLPTLLELALMRLIYSLTGSFAGLLGCASEKKLLDDIGELYGYLEGVACLCTAVFIISFALLASCTSAIRN